MHDPQTVAFEINIPLPWKRPAFLKSERGKKEWAKYHLVTIWHKDPETDGTDDSCGWFMRARHGDKAVLEKIVKRFESDWDRVFKPDRLEHDPEDGAFREVIYHCGYFKPNGNPHFSVHGIVLNLFFDAAIEVFKSDGLSNWKRAKKFLNKNLLDILLFAENPSDNLFDGITRKFEIGCREPYDKRRRDERIRSMAGCIYAWILRAEQPWYRHARWHVHHWRIQVIPLQRLWHWITQRCCKCGKGFRYSECRIGSYSGNAVWHERCEEHPPVKS